MPSLLEDEGTPAPHRLKFIYPRSFSELMAYFSALSGLREAALPDAIVIDGLETFVERLRDRLESDGVDLRTNAGVESVSGTKGKDKKANVTLESGESISCDHGEFKWKYSH